MDSCRFYIATKLEREAEHKLLANKLITKFGWTLTYDWTKHGNVKHEGSDRLRDISVNEIDGVTTAHMVIVLLPGGRGTHIEFGAGLVCNPNDTVVVAIGPGRLLEPNENTCAFYHHPNVKWVTLGSGVDRSNVDHLAIMINAMTHYIL